MKQVLEKVVLGLGFKNNRISAMTKFWGQQYEHSDHLVSYITGQVMVFESF